ncbi:hypothetical protein LshimejAT787_0100390 [Lyophyllum shimeji]|uniref:Uncharacterized protein n=1 Tax=Lyophyllum shimeji TaxID=47721 RepID=A0A9P3PCM3_LYOSH|nr:hypothetical protein LshimejAT787_0100390 [Lyophyllum shimeji]
MDSNIPQHYVCHQVQSLRHRSSEYLIRDMTRVGCTKGRGAVKHPSHAREVYTNIRPLKTGKSQRLSERLTVDRHPRRQMTLNFVILRCNFDTVALPARDEDIGGGHMMFFKDFLYRVELLPRRHSRRGRKGIKDKQSARSPGQETLLHHDDHLTHDSTCALSTLPSPSLLSSPLPAPLLSQRTTRLPARTHWPFARLISSAAAAGATCFPRLGAFASKNTMAGLSLRREPLDDESRIHEGCGERRIF